MKTLPFTKVEAIGNNFVLVNALGMPESAAADWPALAAGMCAHRFGVGSDGLLALLPSGKADFRLAMFNPDGTEDACGNGLRCAAVYIHAAGLSAKRDLTIEAKDGVRHTAIVPSADGSVSAKVNMGRPSLRPADIPANLDVDEVLNYPLDVGGDVYHVTAVQAGSPHAVIYAPLESFWERIPPVSADIEKHPAFPERINVTWCARESPESLRIRTWERGVGPTLGCGTGACAALVAANLHGHASVRAGVISPGGTLEIEWPDRADIFVTGPANIVFEGEWPLSGDAESMDP